MTALSFILISSSMFLFSPVLGGTLEQDIGPYSQLFRLQVLFTNPNAVCTLSDRKEYFIKNFAVRTQGVGNECSEKEESIACDSAVPCDCCKKEANCLVTHFSGKNVFTTCEGVRSEGRTCVCRSGLYRLGNDCVSLAECNTRLDRIKADYGQNEKNAQNVTKTMQGMFGLSSLFNLLLGLLQILPLGAVGGLGGLGGLTGILPIGGL